MNRFEWIRKNVFAVTQTEMASILGVTQGAVSQMEARPDIHASRMATIRNAAKERGLQWDDAWFFESPRSEPPPL